MTTLLPPSRPTLGGLRGRTPRPLVAALLLGLAAGCAGGSRLEGTTVLAYDQCQGIDAGLTRVEFSDVAGIRGSTLLGMSEPEPEPGAEARGMLLIAISRGRQSTPGYALQLDEVRHRDDTAVVEVVWETPESGAVLPQMVTHPCLVVGLQEQADVLRVEAVDQSGEVIGSLDL